MNTNTFSDEKKVHQSFRDMFFNRTNDFLNGLDNKEHQQYYEYARQLNHCLQCNGDWDTVPAQDIDFLNEMLEWLRGFIVFGDTRHTVKLQLLRMINIIERAAEETTER